MRRMGTLSGITALLTLLFAYFFGEIFSLVLACFSAFLLICTFIFKRFRHNRGVRVIFSVVIIFAMVFISFTELYYKPVVNDYSGKELKITAKVVDETYKSYGKYYYFLKTRLVDDEEKSIKFLLKSKDDLGAELDDAISLSCTLSVAKSDYYKTKGYYLSGTVNEGDSIVVERAQSHSIKYYPYRLKNLLENGVNSYMDNENAEICSAIAFGDKNSVDPTVKEDFRRAGLSHILVVSGLHMSVFSTILLFVFKKVFRKRYVYCPLTIFFVLFYMVMTGLSFSVMRSGIMMIIFVVGIMIGGEADSINSLGIAGLFIVLFNPYSAGDIGLLLSFSATLGIILLTTPLSSYIINRLNFSNRIIIAIINILSVTFSASLFTFPLIIIFFHNISLVQIFTNLLITPVFQLLLLMIIMGSVLALTGIAWLYAPFLFIAKWLSSFIHTVAVVFGNLPLSYVNANKTFVYVWMGMCLLMTLCVILMKNYKRTVPLASLMCVLVLLVGIVSDYFVNYNRCTLSVYECGNGITATVAHKGKSVILSCGGDFNYDVTEAMEETGESYNLLSVTGKTNSRNRYYEDIAEEFDLRSILIYDYSTDIVKSNSKTTVFKKDYKAIVGDMEIQYIVRNNKVFTYLSCDGKTVLILPRYGDCSLLDEKYRSADVVVADAPNKNDSLIKSNLLILSCDEESFGKIWGRININSNRLYATFNGDFT
ncbi:MAG: ComEC/Rec2 family competence protein, partial [Ruminococcus sp.]